MVFEELPEDNALKGVLPAQTDHPRENTDSAKCQSSNFPTSFSGFPFQPSSLDEPCLAVALQPRSPTGQLYLALLASRPVPAEAMLSTTNSPCAHKLFLQLWWGGSMLPSPSHGSYCTNDIVDPSYVQHVGDGGHSTTFCRDLKPPRNKGWS